MVADAVLLYSTRMRSDAGSKRSLPAGSATSKRRAPLISGIASSVTVPYFDAVAVSIAGAAGIHVIQKPSPRFGSSGVAAVFTVLLPTVTDAPLTARPVFA